MTDVRIKLGLSETTLAQVDQERGLIPRERWLRSVIEERLAGVPVVTSKTLGKPKPDQVVVAKKEITETFRQGHRFEGPPGGRCVYVNCGRLEKLH